MSMKNSDTIRNRTCDLPVFSAVPQPTVPTRAPFAKVGWSTKCCQTKSSWSHWGSREIFIETKNIPRSTKHPATIDRLATYVYGSPKKNQSPRQTYMCTVVKGSSRHLLWDVTVYNTAEQVVWKNTVPPYSGNVFLSQNDGKFLSGVHSIISEKRSFKVFQGLNPKTKNSQNTVTYT